MKSSISLIVSFLVSFSCYSQTVIWSENFGNGCNQGQSALGFSSGNGSWTETETGANDLESNLWFISATEAGTGLNQCGDGCINNPGLSNRTLHIGANDGVTAIDGGASYNAGGLCGLLFCTATNRRIESPVINCSGNSNILLGFNYIEGGQDDIDDASCWYFDGNTWSLLVNMPKTTLCGTQGRWDSIQIALPASANNNPNVKIGFLWINDDTDGIGSDPSIAVDDIILFVEDNPIPTPVASFSSNNTEVCPGQCLDFYDQSTNGPTSWSWYFPGANTSTSSLQNPTGICYDSPGQYLVSLVVNNSFGNDSSGVIDYITVWTAPQIPTVTQVGNTLTSSNSSTNQWFFNGNPIQGATNQVYTFTESGVYFVRVTNSLGCSAQSSNLELTYTGLEELESSRMLVYPNPAQDEIFIDGTSNILEIIDIYGRVLSKLSSKSTKTLFDVSKLSSGVYFIKNEKMEIVKFLVQK